MLEKELREFRQLFGKSLKTFAEDLNISLSLYEKIERGERQPSRNFLKKLKKKYPIFDINRLFQ